MQNLYSADERARGLTTLLWRHKGKLFFTTLVGLALTLAYLALAPRYYASEAKLFVQLGRENATLDPTATTGQVVGVADSREGEVLAVEELLSSHLLAELVVDHFGPEKILEKNPNKPGLQLSRRLAFLDDYNLNPLRVYSLRDKAILAFQENLKVGAVNKTSVIGASYEAENPKLAQDVLSFMLSRACDEHLRVHRTRGSQEFFTEQAALLKANLSRLEGQYRDLKNQTGLAALESQREIKLELVGSLEEELERARAERDGVQAELVRRQKQLQEQPEFVISERTTGQAQSTGQSLREKVFDLEVREQEMAAKFTNENPLLIQLRDQLAEARRIAADEKVPDEVKSSVSETFKATKLALQEREAELVALNARVKSLETQIAEIRSNLKTINEAEVAIKRLEREIDLARANYTKYSENLEQARINQELEEAKISSLTLMQPPTFSETPVSPKPFVVLALGLVLSAMSGVGIALLADRRRPTVEPTPESIPASEPTIPLPAAAHGERTSSTAASASARRSELVPANPR